MVAADLVGASSEGSPTGGGEDCSRRFSGTVPRDYGDGIGTLAVEMGVCSLMGCGGACQCRPTGSKVGQAKAMVFVSAA